MAVKLILLHNKVCMTSYNVTCHTHTATGFYLSHSLHFYHAQFHKAIAIVFLGVKSTMRYMQYALLTYSLGNKKRILNKVNRYSFSFGLILSCNQTRAESKFSFKFLL